MRLVTWNARKGKFAAKIPILEALNFDLAVIPEIAAPLEALPGVLWLGEDPNYGLAIVARAPYMLERLPELPDVPKYIIPIAVSGPRPFVLLAVWTLNEKPMPYVRAAATAIDRYAKLFAHGPVVMMGDFNSNAAWNNLHPADLNHEAMVRRLRDLGLVSAYHHHRKVEHGMEPEPTFYLYGHEDKPYHIDYCFLPVTWAGQLSEVTVGGYADWRGISDHRPLIAAIRDE